MATVVETVSKIVKTGLMMMVAVVAMTMEMVGGIENYDQGGCNGGCCTETYGKVGAVVL